MTQSQKVGDRRRWSLKFYGLVWSSREREPMMGLWRGGVCSGV